MPLLEKKDQWRVFSILIFLYLFKSQAIFIWNLAILITNEYGKSLLIHIKAGFLSNQYPDLCLLASPSEATAYSYQQREKANICRI